MKLFVAILLIISPFTDLDKIARVNKAKKEAKEAYLSNNFQLAHDKYKFLIDSLGVKEEEVLLDYAHSLYNLNDTINAVNNYEELSASTNKNISSIAEQQLGQIMFDKKQYEPALEHYKNALRRNPNNKDSRYNYELLKKIIQKQEEENKDQENKDQENKDKQDQENKDQENKEEQNKDQEKKDQEEQDQQNKEEQEKKDQEQKDQEKKDGEKDEDQEKKEEQKDKEQEEGEKSEEKEKEQPKPTPSDKLKEMNISEEKAKMILEAMKNNEIQYIQQNRRKATKKKESDKPDW